MFINFIIKGGINGVGVVYIRVLLFLIGHSLMTSTTTFSTFLYLSVCRSPILELIVEYRVSCFIKYPMYDVFTVFTNSICVWNFLSISSLVAISINMKATDSWQARWKGPFSLYVIVIVMELKIIHYKMPFSWYWIVLWKF